MTEKNTIVYVNKVADIERLNVIQTVLPIEDCTELVQNEIFNNENCLSGSIINSQAELKFQFNK